MTNNSEFLDKLDIPQVETKFHQEQLKKHLLSSYVVKKENIFLKGGEKFMFLRSQSFYNKFAIGALVLLLGIGVMRGFNPFKLKSANAQDLVKKALVKVSQLPDSEKEKLASETAKLTEAQNAKDLHIESSSANTGSNVTVLHYTNDKGEDETIEINDDDSLPVTGPTITPTVTPSLTPVPTGVTVTPTGSITPSPTVHYSIQRSGGEGESKQGGEKSTENESNQ